MGLSGAAGAAAEAPEAAQREIFSRAWQAAGSGQRGELEQALASLEGYLLYPYLQYEDLRERRGRATDEEMTGFLEAHADWAFAEGLRSAWLGTMAQQGRWDSLLAYARDASATEVRCAYAHARIETGRTEGLLPLAQSLWAVGRSQPEECDPVFHWLYQQGGVSPGLAWQRIRLAMEGGQARFSLYLKRFLPEQDQFWVDRWYEQDSRGYHRLDRAGKWPDTGFSRDIIDHGLKRLARTDPDRAWRVYRSIEGRFQWPADVRTAILRELALWSAVAGDPGTRARMEAVPAAARDDRLLEWWARHELSGPAWPEVRRVISMMSPSTADDSRWRYWRARALMEMGDRDEASALLGELADEASYHGFLAADRLNLPYTVCPEPPAVAAEDIERLANRADIQRSVELSRADVPNWSRGEWALAMRRLDTWGLRAAAALAVREGWPDRAIVALGNSGDRRWYEWRFPLDYRGTVESHSVDLGIDPSWAMGLMRSESALAEDAVSSAGARGLMQLMPGTARRLAREHGYPYAGRSQLMIADDNIRFGMTYLRELSDRFGNNPVLVSGAYNAGPNAVDRWLQDRPIAEPAIWVETLPYFETRDYIPRVLAFSTIYDWRLQRPVIRVSSRMPALDSGSAGGTMPVVETAEVVCRAAGRSLAGRD